ITTWAAIAATDLKKGQKVGLLMKDGLLYASDDPGADARGTATCNTDKGEDVGISDIEGIVKLDIGKITILEVPDIQRGGSRKADPNKIKKGLEQAKLVGAIGTEAIATLKNIGVKPGYLYGVTQAAIEAAHSGLSFAIVCTSTESPALLQRLNEENLQYNLIDAKNK
ncbi:MAG: Crp/Fnr family transcriptional regulator, partial [Dehalococcoidales bacterium]|nr:Crp/Fnr family transcriptional regulator [Dehalococcoidales bacterium]